MSRPPHRPPSGTDGDFARLRAAFPEAAPAAVARLLGRALRPARPQAPRTKLVQQQVAQPRQAMMPSAIPWEEQSFWRVERAERAPDTALSRPTDQHLTFDDLGPSAFRYGAAPEAEAACPWPQLESRLRVALAGQRPSRSLDLPAALRKISRAEPLERLPRASRAAWPRVAVVLNDRDPRLMPLVADHAMVIDALRRLMGQAHVHLVELGEAGLRRAATAPGTWARRLPEADVVLLLSDLGTLDHRLHSTTGAAWAGLCAALHASGHRLVALSPTSEGPAGCPAQALGWGGRPMLDAELRRDRAEDLAALLSLSSWAPRGLLRDLRRLLGPQRADLVTELDVWQRPGAALHGGQLALSAVDLAALRGRLARALASDDPTLSADTVRAAEALAREWSQVNPPEARIGDRVALNLALRGLPAEPEDATWLDRLGGTLRSGLGPKEAPARAWAAVGRRLAQSVPPERLLEPAGEQLRAVQIWSEQRQLVPDGEALPDATPERWAVRQVGQQLILQPEPEVAHPDVPAAAHRPGSPVGWLLAKQTLVVVRDGQRGSPKPLVPGLPMPFDGAKTLSLDTGVETLTLGLLRRADDGGWQRMGRDRYGLWAEVDVKTSIAEATQRFRWINPGRFMIGSPESEEGRHSDEGPQHEVTLSHGYWMADTPVTQGLYLAVMGENPSKFVDPPDLRRPVEQVSWDKSVAFVRRLSALSPSGASDGLAIQLPSEAQWERACRAGTDTATYAPAGKGLDDIAWTAANAMRSTHTVGQHLPNAWGLFDTLGNVWEWCADLRRSLDEPYPGGPRNDPIGKAGPERAFRGGSWGDLARHARAGARDALGPSDRTRYLGLRLARVRAHQLIAVSHP